MPVDRNADSWTEDNEMDALVSTVDGIVGEPHIGVGYMYRNYLAGGLNKIRTAPLWLARSGSVYGGSLSTGGGGGYWSSTVGGSSVAYQLYFYSGGVDPTSGNSRHYGYSIRCVAE